MAYAIGASEDVLQKKIKLVDWDMLCIQAGFVSHQSKKEQGSSCY